VREQSEAGRSRRVARFYAHSWSRCLPAVYTLSTWRDRCGKKKQQSGRPINGPTPDCFPPWEYCVLQASTAIESHHRFFAATHFEKLCRLGGDGGSDAWRFERRSPTRRVILHPEAPCGCGRGVSARRLHPLATAVAWRCGSIFLLTLNHLQLLAIQHPLEAQARGIRCPAIVSPILLSLRVGMVRRLQNAPFFYSTPH
jgi:hypothetical protein